MTGFGVFEHDAVGIEGLAGDDSQTVVIAELQTGFVLFCSSFNRHLPFAGHDIHSKLLLDVIIDGFCSDFPGEAGDSCLEEKIRIKDKGFFFQIAYALDEIYNTAGREACLTGKLLVDGKLAAGQDFGMCMEVVSCSRFFEGFYAANREICLIDWLIDDLYTFAMDGLDIAIFHELLNGTADGIA